MAMSVDNKQQTLSLSSQLNQVT